MEKQKSILTQTRMKDVKIQPIYWWNYQHLQSVTETTRRIINGNHYQTYKQAPAKL